MPNAGLPRTVDGHTAYLVSPEEMASFALKFIQAGASLIGGCCGTTPDHTRAMESTLRAFERNAALGQGIAQP
jgi:homocysteine S-methyltransferase